MRHNVKWKKKKKRENILHATVCVVYPPGRWGVRAHSSLLFCVFICRSSFLTQQYCVLHTLQLLRRLCALVYRQNQHTKRRSPRQNIKRIKSYILHHWRTTAYILAKTSTHNVFVYSRIDTRLYSNHWHLDMDAAQRSTKHDTLADLLCMPSSWHLCSSSEH